MTHIEQMIQDLCPHGVEWKTLGEVCEMKRGSTITANQAEEGEIPVIAGGQKLAYFHNQSNRTGKNITVAGSGAYAGYVAYWEQPIFVSDAFTVTPKEASLDIKFVYYFLTNIQDKIYHTKKGSGVPHVHPSSIADFEIPLPPLEIQKKIVECLDKFSTLAAELQAELQMRRKQYEYYRTQLLTPHSDCNSADKTDDCKLDSQGYTKGIAKVYDWQWKTLGEIGEMIKGSGIQKSDFVEDGKPCIHYGQVHTYFGTFAHKVKSYIPEKMYDKCKKAHTGDLIIATTSEDVEACCKATAWLGEEDVAVSGDAHIYRHTQNPKYMAYLFQTEMFAQQKRKCATGAKVTRVHGDDMLKFRFPLPPLAEQARIVAILDKFEALTTSLSDGIPAEQAAQQKRYEHYRDLLLGFEKREKE